MYAHAYLHHRLRIHSDRRAPVLWCRREARKRKLCALLSPFLLELGRAPQAIHPKTRTGADVQMICNTSMGLVANPFQVFPARTEMQNALRVQSRKFQGLALTCEALPGLFVYASTAQTMYSGLIIALMAQSWHELRIRPQFVTKVQAGFSQEKLGRLDEFVEIGKSLVKHMGLYGLQICQFSLSHGLPGLAQTLDKNSENVAIATTLAPSRSLALPVHIGHTLPWLLDHTHCAVQLSCELKTLLCPARRSSSDWSNLPYRLRVFYTRSDFPPTHTFISNSVACTSTLLHPLGIHLHRLHPALPRIKATIVPLLDQSPTFRQGPLFYVASSVIPHIPSNSSVSPSSTVIFRRFTRLHAFNQ
ncbi:uncharacterized protein PGTG_03132 [Puccinia graminis f. sp. tritici CRL 75-36-700-3]|uniref:Uncharacterized protein n=1 Tax=Puccinia graminis f. sp. tritici (strain CRL 75-36-700-3 / race SCCL) TaxID=418459 RepID=E3JYQ1_PUCGT|nr:uncharacterized protein PGTG_03132 [Puccinia graminis f. sp. tritici CRL 75-36-700-3]EFP77176.1 hypothetical protein PGTG_03132 [Puccinia graminis f. sp. tritici CRL 75-36-700-3]